ncbi:MAG: ABC transporter permease [Hyphomonadaceae bacterium]|nr:ABC transporter permease [Hyphomonadaceae bacterium]
MISAIVDMAIGLSRWRTSYKLGLQDIELRYKRSLLGPFWISAAMVAMVLALAYVFADVFQTGFAAYIAYISAGLLAWYLILALVNEACGSMIEHGQFLQNVRMPLTVIAGRVVFRNAVVFLHNLIAIVGLLFVFGASITWGAIAVLPGAVTILLFGYCLVIALGPLCARFRDIPLLVQNVMQVIFFLTPIFWMPSGVSHRPAFTVVNPFYHLIELVRAPLLGSEPTSLNWQVALCSCAFAGLLAILSASIASKRLTLWI